MVAVQDEKKDGPKLFVVGLKDCKPCTELQDQLKDEEIKKTLKEKWGTDEVTILYADEDTEEGNKARNICYSLDKFSSPMLVVEHKDEKTGKNRLCLINDKLEEDKCALFREMPL